MCDVTKKLFSHQYVLYVCLIVLVAVFAGGCGGRSGAGDTGGISVTTVPEGADVFLNGSLQGQTPLQIQNVSAGTHELLIQMAYYADVEVSVHVKAGETTVLVQALSPLWFGAVQMLTEGGTPLSAIGTEQSVPVIVSANVNLPPGDLAAVGDEDTESPVRLYRSSTGGPGADDWEPVARPYLFDSGDLFAHGDEIKGDRVYSNKLVFNETEPGAIYLKVEVELADGSLFARYLELEVLLLDEQAGAQIQSVHEDILTELNTLAPGTSVEEMLAHAANWLAGRDGIDNVEQSGDVLEITHASGITSFIHLQDEANEDVGWIRGGSKERTAQPVIPLDEQTRGDTLDAGGISALDVDPALLPLSETGENEVGSRAVLIWAPFAAEFSPWDETAGLFQRFGESDIGFNVVAKSNYDADVNSLRSIANYGMVVLATHGSGGRWLATAELASTADTTYLTDLQSGRMAIWQQMKLTTAGNVTSYSPTYAVRDTWLAANVVGQFPNSIIVNNSCESLRGNDLWNFFADRGAGALFGHTRIVTSRFAVEKVYELVEGLAAGQTTGASYVQETDPYSFHNAVWEMRGNEELTFALGLINGSFEDGMLGWVGTGDARTVSGLGPLQPTDEFSMGLISTGLGFTVSHGGISQTFRVPDNATQLRFDWNYLSEEFLEWIGSGYQDPWEVSITPVATGQTDTLLEWRVDTIAEAFGASYAYSPFYNTDELDAVGEHGFYLHPDPDVRAAGGNLIWVSPTIVFDQGDVWMTHWQIAEALDISAYAGEVVTLAFRVEDTGDTSWDSVVLLDNIVVQ